SVRLKFGRCAEFNERIIRPLFASQSKPKPVAEAGVLWRRCNGTPEYALSITVTAQLTIKISEIDRRRRILRAESQRCLIFSFGIISEPATYVKISKRCAPLGPICVDALSSDKLGGRPIESRAVGRGLAGGGHGSEN